MGKKIHYGLGFKINTIISDKNMMLFDAAFRSCLHTIAEKTSYKYIIQGNIEREFLGDEELKYVFKFTMEKQSIWNRIKLNWLDKYFIRRLYRKSNRKYKDES